MISISVQTNIDDAVKMLRDLDRNAVPRAMVAALNRTAASTEVAAARAISQESAIPVSEVKAHIWRTTANKYRPEVRIIARGYAPNLKKYRPTQQALGVVASPWRKRRVHRHTFLMPSGSVVVRKGKARFPIKGVRGPSVRKEFMRGYAIKVMREKVAERFPLEFERAWRRFSATE